MDRTPGFGPGDRGSIPLGSIFSVSFRILTKTYHQKMFINIKK